MKAAVQILGPIRCSGRLRTKMAEKKGKNPPTLAKNIIENGKYNPETNYSLSRNTDLRLSLRDLKRLPSQTAKASSHSMTSALPEHVCDRRGQ